MNFIDFKIRVIDDSLAAIIAQSSPHTASVSGSAYAINKNIDFHFERCLATNSGSDCFLAINEETQLLKREFVDTVKQSQGSPLGSYTFRNCIVLGQPGIIVDPEHSTCWIGYSLGWNLNMLAISVERNALGQLINQNVLRLDRTIFDAAKQHSVEKAHLLSLPGYAVFGHWIIDIVPRLEQIASESSEPDFKICAPPTARWGQELARLFDIDLTISLPLKLGEGLQVHELQLRSCIKSNRILDNDSAKTAWDALRAALAQDTHNEATRAPKLYVSRSKFESPRKFHNGEAIDAYFRSIGWKVIHPESLSLSEQAKAFSAASLIAGEDGSALHNSIYAGVGTKILCLDFQRSNLLHASLANVLQHKLAYLHGDAINADDNSVRWNMPMSRLAHAIELFENY